jgi:uncharacterized membrane protein
VNKEDEKIIDTFGLIAIVFSALGLFTSGIALGTYAILIGLIGLNRILDKPDEFKGRFFGSIAIVLGLIDILIVVFKLVN